MTIEDMLAKMHTCNVLRIPPVSPLILCVKDAELPPNTVNVFRYTFTCEYGKSVHTSWQETKVNTVLTSRTNKKIIFYFMWRNLHTFNGVVCLDLAILALNENERADGAHVLAELHNREKSRAIEHIVHNELDRLFGPSEDNINPHETTRTIIDYVDARI